MVHEYLGRFNEHGRNIAIVVNDNSITYQVLLERVYVETDRIKRTVSSGAVVALVGDYSINSVVYFLALAACGCSVVPIANKTDPLFHEKLRIAQVEYTLDSDSLELNLDKIVNELTVERNSIFDKLAALNAAGLVLFSSGSTGKPKAMVHDLNRLLNSYLGKKAKNLVFMVFLMFDHIGGLNSLLGGLANGSTLVLVNSRSPESVASLVEKYKVNILPASPTFLNLLCASGAASNYDMTSIRLITYGTETMPQTLLERIKKVFPRAKLLQTFGTSETGISATTSLSSSSTYIKFDDPTLEYKVVDGELWLKSETQVLGYLNASMEAFTGDGWFRTGDLVELIDGGYLKIKGRLKELINVGGEKVLPSEIESEALKVDIIKDCMAYGYQNALTGQSVAIDVVLCTDIPKQDALKIIRMHFYKNLAKFKVPTQINFVEQTNYGERFKKLRIQR